VVMSANSPEATRRRHATDVDDSARTEESREDSGAPREGPANDLAHAPGRIGPYRIDGILGRGGMGEVYRAWDPRLERHVALKRILPDRASPKARVRFWREARILAALKHPGLVALHDIGEVDDALYLTMELVTGEPLSTARGARWSLDAALSLVIELADAAGAAHAAGVIHRDIKPSNILIELSGAPRLIDFGLAHKDDEEELTSSGALLGTWSWMAPEQISGEPATPRTDVHALGAVLYTLLAGESPYQRETREATAAAILASARPSLRRLRPDLPPGLLSLLDLALSRHGARRPANGTAFANALKNIALGEGLLLSRFIIREGLEAARSAIAEPGLSTGPERVRRPSPRPRPYALMGALLLAGALAIGFWRGETDTPAISDIASEFPTHSLSTLRPELRRTHSAGALRGRDELGKARTRAIAILPFEDPDHTGIGGALAELMRLELRTIAGTEPVPYRELLGHSKGLPGIAELMHQRLGQPKNDAVLSGRVTRLKAGAEFEIEMRLHVTGSSEPMTIFTLDTPSSEFGQAARTLMTALSNELGAPVKGASTQTISLEALHQLLAADEALHHDEWRAFRAATEAAFRESPTHPRVLFAKLRLALALDETDSIQSILASLVTRTDLSPRDASYASILDAQYGKGRREDLPVLVEKHLREFPRDIDVKYVDLGLKFMATGSGKLKRAAEAATTLLRSMPNSPLAASRLVRALSWLGRSDEARRLFSELGINPENRGMSSVFGELAMYEGNFDEAILRFERNLEPDGDMTFYAANMHIAALMLANRCWEAYTQATHLMRPHALGEAVFGIDWTYFLSVNAAACDGSLDRAIDGLERWHSVTGSESGHGYRGFLPTYRVLGELEETDFADALLKDVVALEGADTSPALWVILYFATDIAHIEALEALYRKGFHAASPETTEATSSHLSRAVRGLEAKAAMLRGHTARGLTIFEELASAGGFEVISEGSLFERTRWLSVLALHYENSGMRERAISTWQELLSLAYPRLLEMPSTVLARQRLRALGVSTD
jgi:serine/threonine protein kinase/tetratricopeptide (TPR) repeat protein